MGKMFAMVKKEIKLYFLNGSKGRCDIAIFPYQIKHDLKCQTTMFGLFDDAFDYVDWSLVSQIYEGLFFYQS